MKHPIISLVVIFCLLFFSMPVLSADKGELFNIELQKKGSNQIDSAKKFPTTRPPGAVGATWSIGYGNSKDYFQVYFWWQGSYLWMQVVPQEGSEPFICSSNFSIIQNVVKYDTVYLGTEEGSSHCAGVYAPSIYWFSQWGGNRPSGADFSEDFNIHYDGGETTYHIEIQGGGSSYDVSNVDTGVDSGCFIQSIRK